MHINEFNCVMYFKIWYSLGRVLLFFVFYHTENGRGNLRKTLRFLWLWMGVYINSIIFISILLRKYCSRHNLDYYNNARDLQCFISVISLSLWITSNLSSTRSHDRKQRSAVLLLDLRFAAITKCQLQNWKGSTH